MQPRCCCIWNNMEKNRVAVYDTVKKHMERLMPGWFTKMDDIMDSAEPYHSIECITDIVMKHPERDIPDVIHEYFKDTWFHVHADGDENW